MTKLERAKYMLEQYEIAEEKVLLNQEYEIGGNKFTKADLKTIQKGIVIYEGKVSRLEKGRKPGAVIRSLTPRG